MALRGFLALGLLGSADVEVENVTFGVVGGVVEDQRTDIRPGCCSKLTTTRSRDSGLASAVVAAPLRARVGLDVVRLAHGRQHLLEVLPQLRVIAQDLVFPDLGEQDYDAAVSVGELRKNRLVGGHTKRLIRPPDGHDKIGRSDVHLSDARRVREASFAGDAAGVRWSA